MAAPDRSDIAFRISRALRLDRDGKYSDAFDEYLECSRLLLGQIAVDKRASDDGAVTSTRKSFSLLRQCVQRAEELGVEVENRSPSKGVAFGGLVPATSTASPTASAARADTAPSPPVSTPPPRSPAAGASSSRNKLYARLMGGGPGKHNGLSARRASEVALRVVRDWVESLEGARTRHELSLKEWLASRSRGEKRQERMDKKREKMRSELFHDVDYPEHTLTTDRAAFAKMDSGDLVLERLLNLHTMRRHPLRLLTVEFVRVFRMLAATAATATAQSDGSGPAQSEHTALVGDVDWFVRHLARFQSTFVLVDSPLDKSTCLTLATRATRVHVMPLVSPLLFPVYERRFHHLDAMLDARCMVLCRKDDAALLRMLCGKKDRLRLSRYAREGTPFFRGAVEVMHSMPKSTTPADVFALLHVCAQEVVTAVQGMVGTQTVLGADDTLPLFSFLVVRARVPNLCARLEMCTDLATDRELQDRAGWLCASFSVAVQFLINLDAATEAA